jgi:hypothetical protein
MGGNMEGIVPPAAGLRGVGRVEDPDLNGISEGTSPTEPFDGIDWSAAAPSWASIITGLVLPSLAVVALVILIDVALCSLFERWINHSWGVAPWLLSIMVFPLALCVFFCGIFFLYLPRSLGRSAAKRTP